MANASTVVGLRFGDAKALSKAIEVYRNAEMLYMAVVGRNTIVIQEDHVERVLSELKRSGIHAQIVPVRNSSELDPKQAAALRRGNLDYAKKYFGDREGHQKRVGALKDQLEKYGL